MEWWFRVWHAAQCFPETLAGAATADGCVALAPVAGLLGGGVRDDLELLELLLSLLLLDTERSAVGGDFLGVGIRHKVGWGVICAWTSALTPETGRF